MAAWLPKHTGDDKMKLYQEQTTNEEELVITIVGAGGIGSNLLPHLARALSAGELIENIGPVRIRIIDGDEVEAGNLQHQNFTTNDVNSFKTDSIVNPLKHLESQFLRIESITENVRGPMYIVDSDLVIVAVDSMLVRRLVHRYADYWLDLRCQGDGYIAIDYRIDPVDVTKLTPLDSESASCQLVGAIESGNIQFGHLLAGAHGSQWAIQFLRIIAGEVTASLPSPQTANISFGTLGRFELNPQTIDPRSEIQPTLHDEETIQLLVRSGDFDSLPIRETLAYFATQKNWKNLWNLADLLRREVSVLFDSEDKVWVDVGTSGQVRLAPPEGAIIPFKLWIHTHPWDAYWSSTDLNSLMQFSGILNEAIVLGNDHFKRTIHSQEKAPTPLELGSALENWTDEELTYYNHQEVIVDGS
jgi:hypothetical protein